MGLPPELVRVNKRTPCPVCGKPDWCVVSRDGQRAFCPRVEGGLGWKGRMGYLHFLNRPLPPIPNLPKVKFDRPVDRDIPALMRVFRDKWETQPFKRFEHSCRLNLPEACLDALDVGIMGSSVLAFPMRRADAVICGIRLRDSDTGRKWATPGSQNALFIPCTHDLGQWTVVVEGPTDTAALVSINVNVVGRPDATSGSELVAEFCAGRRIVLFREPDGAGRRGVMRQIELAKDSEVVVIDMPPGIKDAREWVAAGLTKEHLECLL